MEATKRPERPRHETPSTTRSGAPPPTSLDWHDVLWREWTHLDDKGQARRLFPAVADRISDQAATSAGVLLGVLAAAGCLLPLLSALPVALPLAIVAGGTAGVWGGVRARRWFAEEAPRPWVLPLKRFLSPMCRPDPQHRPPRPQLARLEHALEAAIHADGTLRKDWEPVLERLAAEREHPPEVETLLAQLQGVAWPERFLAPFLLAARGGEAVPGLVNLIDPTDGECRHDAWRALQLLSDETMARLSRRADALVCPDCLTRFATHRLADDAADDPEADRGSRVDSRLARFGRLIGRAIMHRDLLSMRYCGCRTCGQSRRFLEAGRGIVAVLDKDMQPEYETGLGELRVNALKRDAPFEFDRVQIRNAADRDVERFCIAVGNDTDHLRHGRYRSMPCVVSADCDLSPATLRMLDQTFGEVTLSRLG